MSVKSFGAAAVIAASLLGGTALAASTIASIVGADGTINGCYAQRNGALRVVAAGTACGRGELAISWNQQGVQGDIGPPGPAGPPGPPGPAGSAPTFVTGTVHPLAGVVELGSVGGLTLSGDCSGSLPFSLLHTIEIRPPAGHTLDISGSYAAGTTVSPVPLTFDQTSFAFSGGGVGRLSLIVTTSRLEGTARVITEVATVDAQFTVSTSTGDCQFNVLSVSA